jgi:[acyl-carrier-protein] S-malonyltransferase
LMADASQRLKALLDEITFKEPNVPIMNNADAIPLTHPESIKASLVRQLHSPLLWEDSIHAIMNFGIDVFVEVGPGRVLSGLIKRIVPSAKTYNVEDLRSLTATLDALRGVV